MAKPERRKPAKAQIPEPERRKPAEERKEAHLRVRVADSHMNEFKIAALRAGISLSAWATERLLKCAREENKKEA